MRLYSVHIRRHGLDIDRDIAVVKEGFCWPAFLFGGFWALWRRHWLLALALFAVPALIAGAGRLAGLGPAAQAVLGGAWSVWVGLTANDIRRVLLDRTHFVEAAVAAGRTPDEALYAYLSETPSALRPPARAAAPAPMPMSMPASGGPGGEGPR